MYTEGDTKVTRVPTRVVRSRDSKVSWLLLSPSVTLHPRRSVVRLLRTSLRVARTVLLALRSRTRFACRSAVLSGCGLEQDLVGARVTTDGTLRLDGTNVVGMTFLVWWLLVVLTLVEACHFLSLSLPIVFFSFFPFLSHVHSFHMVFLSLSVSARDARVEKIDHRLSPTKETCCRVWQ